MKFTEYLIEDKTGVLVEMPFGPFKRKKAQPEPSVAPTPMDPNESPDKRFKRKLDEMYPKMARLASYCHDAGYDANDLIEEMGEIVHAMYKKKQTRTANQERPLMRGEEEARDEEAADK